jgi:hypothetical protein
MIHEMTRKPFTSADADLKYSQAANIETHL